MIPSTENQIDILLNYKSNFEDAIQTTKSRITELTNTVNIAHNRFNEIAKSRTISANEERKSIKENLALLKEELTSYTKILTKKSEANEFVSKGVLTQRNALDTMIKGTEAYNKRASNIIKERLTRQVANEEKYNAETEQLRAFSTKLNKEHLADELITHKQSTKTKLLEEEKYNAETEQLRAFSNKLNKEHLANELITHKQSNKSKLLEEEKYNAESKAFANWGANFNKQMLNEELAAHKANVKAKAEVTTKERLKESNTFKGSFTSGSSFGHKVGTTMQYAVAGTAIFGVASALIAMSKEALVADLNMRTMSAVLKLNVTDAMALDSQVRKLGETYGGTTGEIEQVAIALGRAGVATKDITKATEITLAMARLTGDTFEQSASAVISYQQVFGNTTSIQTLGDKLAYIANVSRLSTQDIGTFSNYALAAAKDVGLTEDAVGGLAAAFSNAGVNASTIGTQIRRFTTLLTDDSEAVTNFYRTLGINQKNLLMDLQKGGKASNEAVLGFVKQLQTVDKATFTNLTGQMDILAANSLQLMRNNTENIDKFVRDLQTGMAGQLDSTKVILNSIIVTYEGMWNSLKNIAADGLQGLTDDFTQISRLFDLIGGNEQKAALKGLAVQQQKEDEALSIHRQAFANKKISVEELDKYEQYFMNKRILREEAAKGISKQNSQQTFRTKAEEIAALNKMIESTDSVLFDEKSTKAQLDIAKRRNDELISRKKELVGVIKEEVKANVAAADSVSISDNIKAVNTLIDAKQDYSALESLINKQVSSNRTKNTEEIKKQVEALKGYTDVHTELDSIVTSSKSPYDLLTKSASKYEDVVQSIKLLQKDNVTGSNDAEINKLIKFKNGLTEIQNINSKNIQDETALLSLSNKKTAATKQEASTNERAQRKAETEAEKLRKYDETKSQHLTSIAELEAQLNQEGEITLSKAESTYRLDTQLLGLAYERYAIAKGTTGEKAAEVTYLEAHTKYLKSSVVMVTKQVELEEKRKSLSIELTSSLSQAIEGEQVRLGIIEKSTDSEYEKLRVKIEQGILDRTLVGNELVQAQRRLAELQVLQNKKKDVHTLAMEYQRELQDQETMGYMAAKAGLASLESGMMNFFDVTSDGWLDWHSLASNVLTDIYKQLLQQLVIKQLVSGIAGGISGAFSSTPAVNSPMAGDAIVDLGSVPNIARANGGMIPTKGYAKGGVLSGGSGIRDDIYLGNVSGTQVFAMGGEFITRKDSVNAETKGTLDYINKTGTTPTQGSQVNVPVSINIENQTGQAISADMMSAITKQNQAGDYEKVINIILKASQTDPRMRSMLKGR